MILMETLYITHPSCRLHDMGKWHPECPERLAAINDQLVANGVMPFLRELDAGRATPDDLLRVHTPEHLEFLLRHAHLTAPVPVDNDTIFGPHTLEAIWHAAGAGITAVDAVLNDTAHTAFCAVRPPGHHAMRDKAMGFCFVNNVAIAAAYALARYGLDRIAIVDFDVHHGNGTEDIFAGNPHVLMCSFYQSGLFPNADQPSTAENMLNIPVAPYTARDDLRMLVGDLWIPRLRAFKPQLIFISAGFDGHREDDMGQLGLVESDYGWITQQVMNVATETACGRVISFLEGGYNLSALGRSVVAHMRSLAAL